ncbi:hypothetical protein U1Q18_052259 [Sarracenia purpurea var. burkii]
MRAGAARDADGAVVVAAADDVRAGCAPPRAGQRRARVARGIAQRRGVHRARRRGVAARVHRRCAGRRQRAPRDAGIGRGAAQGRDASTSPVTYFHPKQEEEETTPSGDDSTAIVARDDDNDYTEAQTASVVAMWVIVGVILIIFVVLMLALAAGSWWATTTPRHRCRCRHWTTITRRQPADSTFAPHAATARLPSSWRTRSARHAGRLGAPGANKRPERRRQLLQRLPRSARTRTATSSLASVGSWPTASRRCRCAVLGHALAVADGQGT